VAERAIESIPTYALCSFASRGSAVRVLIWSRRLTRRPEGFRNLDSPSRWRISMRCY
jgi:hypothetical protein